LEKLLPTRYDGPVESGGSTNPWIVFAILESEIDEPRELPYVVKLFSQSNVEQQPCIAKEFICNLLAKEFDLLVPESGIINLHTKFFLKTLKKRERQILEKKFDGNTYASVLMDGTLVTKGLTNSLNSIEEKATIFAFDCLILNSDRGGFRNKPNMLIYEEQFMLIDHELTFSFIDNYNKEGLKKLLYNIIEKRQVVPYQFQQHLFYESLKDYKGVKAGLFDTFNEYLSKLNINKLELLLKELERNEIYTGSSIFLMEYLREIKSNNEKFSECLYKSIL